MTVLTFDTGNRDTRHTPAALALLKIRNLTGGTDCGSPDERRHLCPSQHGRVTCTPRDGDNLRDLAVRSAPRIDAAVLPGRHLRRALRVLCRSDQCAGGLPELDAGRQPGLDGRP